MGNHPSTGVQASNSTTMAGLLQSVVPALNELTAPKGLAALGVAGVLSHRLYFIRGEHHLQAPMYLKTWVLGSLALVSTVFLAETTHHGHDPAQAGLDALRIFATINLSYFVPLFTSVVIYRLFEHRLRGFNGPKLAAATKLWHFWKILFTSNNRLLDQLHYKYGRIVRTGMKTHSRPIRAITTTRVQTNFLQALKSLPSSTPTSGRLLLDLRQHASSLLGTTCFTLMLP